MQITGTHINYYFVCKRELWLFSHDLQMEQTSDIVYTGKVIDETSYNREEKHFDIDGLINIDWIDTKKGVIHEVKKSDSVEKAHEMQVLYYIWYLKQKGVNGFLQQKVEGNLQSDENHAECYLIHGEIDYPKLKRKTFVHLTPEKELELLTAIEDIKMIISKDTPPDRLNKKFCKTCSYFELCWS